MSFLKRILFLILLPLAYCLLLASSIHAADEFDTKYEITYTVNPNASVSVVQKISLTNKLANIYASQYQVSLGTTRIRGVWARDDSGELTPQVIKKESTTIIKIEFTQKVVGKGKTLNFTLGYISDDYAMKNGRVLEVGIPKMADADQLLDYQVNLIIPYSFEEPAFILPQPTRISQTEKGRVYFFNKQQLKNQSITAAFGNFQVFEFNLKYHLENEDSSLVRFEISLPPDTPFQKVYLETINPPPLNIKVDGDGNWLASYQLKPKENLEIIATGAAEIFMDPKNNSIQPTSHLEDYLSKQKFWEIDDPQVKKLANQLKTPKEIYNFVVNNLLYDYKRISQKPQRMGAAVALKNKESAICMEFTDLFIALARAAGIPAREVNGFAYTNNPKLRPLSLKQDVLHAWPQYYDQKQKLWISVDPTWGNTTGGVDFFDKLDLNHFIFVFHGLDSELPLPAGAYKNENGGGKDIEIKFGQKPKAKPSVKIKINFPKKVIAGLPIKGSISIKNTGNVALYNKHLLSTFPDLGFQNQKLQITSLPPFATFEKEIILPKTSLLTQGEKEILVQFDNQKFSHKLQVYSFLPQKIASFIAKIYSWFLALFSK